MDQKKAMQILIKLMEKYPFTEEEKEAVMTALGVLSWTSLSEGFKKAVKEKREREKSNSTS